MRHQTHDVTLTIANAGDAVERAVGIRVGADLAGRIRVTEDHLPIRLDLLEHIGRRVVIAFAVGDRQLQHLLRPRTQR